jgi:polar amino acid transport system permease protein
LSAAALLLAMPLGMVLGVARVSPWRWLRWPVTALVFVVRGLPLLMVMFWAYFFLPSVTGVKTDQFTTMLIALVMFDAAYLAEIVRAGIQGLPRGQMETARALGLGYGRAMRLVLLPQALRSMLPSLVNQFVSTIKETSLGYVIGLAEVSFIATQINTQVFTKPVADLPGPGRHVFHSLLRPVALGLLARAPARAPGPATAATAATAASTATAKVSA